MAVLDVELLKADYLPNAGRIMPGERRRLDTVAELVRGRLRAEGYDTVPATRTGAAIRAADPGQYLHACNGCERRIARDLGADWVVVGWIQFVSYLILNLNVMVIDVETGVPVARAFVDMRGNTDRSWRRATTYMLDHILVERLARRRQELRTPAPPRAGARSPRAKHRRGPGDGGPATAGASDARSPADRRPLPAGQAPPRSR